MKWHFIEILDDNYSWILSNENQEAIVIDCGDAQAIHNFLLQNNLNLKYILLTHAHADHIEGTDELKRLTGAQVVGHKFYVERLPALDILVEDGVKYNFLDAEVEVKYTPGHCADHLIYFFTKEKYLFTGDLLFSLGCGRVFEGSPMDMVKSLMNILNYPIETLVFPSHEYTKANYKFVKSLGYFDLSSKEEVILNQKMTLPTTIEFEAKCNPFLNIDNDEFKIHVMATKNIDNVSFFMQLRTMKNDITKLVGG